jgi:hypothetical protein
MFISFIALLSRGAGPRVVRLPTLEHNMVLCFSYVSLHSNDTTDEIEEL